MKTLVIKFKFSLQLVICWESLKQPTTNFAKPNCSVCKVPHNEFNSPKREGKHALTCVL